jgi:phosphoribosyl 1,2-cyclic phosphodiesterase
VIQERRSHQLRLAILGSGSGGNAAYLEADGTRLLIEAGFSCRELEVRLASLGVDPARVDAVLLSHEHGDHARGALRFARKFGTVIAGTRGTLRASGLRPGLSRTLAFLSGEALDVGNLRIATASVPHDAADPVAFRIEARASRVGFALDLGHAPAAVRELLSACDTVILESNHDAEMLERGPYPQELKDRLRGPRGHLSNGEAADVLSEVVGSGTRSLVLAHLSRINNRADLALATALRALSFVAAKTRVTVAQQEGPAGWIEN